MTSDFKPPSALVEDGEVSLAITDLRRHPGSHQPIEFACDLLTRLSAALKGAEAKLKTARRDALEEAAARCDAIAQKVFEIRMLSEDMRGFDIQPAGCAAAIRALQTKDTTP